jgi:hypothetical protein
MKLFRISFLSLLLSLLFACYSFAQPGVALPFLIASPDARASGMGETGTAIADNINASFWNPGGLGFLTHTRINDNNVIYFESSNTMSFLPLYTNNGKISINTTEGIYIKPFRGVLAIDLISDGLGEMTRTFENGKVAGTYTATEWCMGLAYGTSIGSDLGIGGKFKYYGSNLDPAASSWETPGTAYGYAFDMGVLWKPDLELDSNGLIGNKSLSFGLNLQNIGPKVTYRNESDPIPTCLRLGTALKLNISQERKLTIAVDGAKTLVKYDSLGSDALPGSLVKSWDKPLDWSIGLGAEYRHNRALAIRAGYFTEPASMGNRSYLTFGGSFRIFIFQGDVSYAFTSGQTKYLTNTLKFTLRVGGQ